MNRHNFDASFWLKLDELVAVSKLVVDRPKGSRHSLWDSMYPLDYGYLEGSSSMDGHGIDVWVGSLPNKKVDAIMCIVDTYKKDSEIKLLIGCTNEEKSLAYAFQNVFDSMKALMVLREQL